MKEKTIILAIGQFFLVSIFSLQSLEAWNGLNLYTAINPATVKTAVSSIDSDSSINNDDTNNNYFYAVASWYGAAFDGRKMANGQVFNMYDETLVAHKKLPFGTKLEIVNPDNNSVLYATVTDRGPYISGRDFDLSYAGAQKLGIVNNGVKKLKIRIIE
ncbi:MAG TPA: septal ring lytic transglycosylase RlpA family protein [bacterium]|nr:septal ring lytic transglycosylase RlpA family protein [bacterium]